MMARRAFSAVLVALGLLAASLAWWGFTLQRTVFDASRSDRFARALLDSGEVQDALVRASADALEAALPAQARSAVPLAEVTVAARAALEAPAVRTALEQALVGTHRYLIGDVDQAPTLDPAPLDAELRAQLARIRPDLADIVPALPPVKVELPDTGLPVVRDLRGVVDQVTSVSALAAVAGVLAALVVAAERAPVLRRVGWWAIIAGGLWVALRFAVPALASALVPARAALVAGVVEAIADGMATPGLVLAVGGLAALVAGLVLPRRTLALGRGGRAARRRAAERRASRRAPLRPEPARAAAGVAGPFADRPHGDRGRDPYGTGAAPADAGRTPPTGSRTAGRTVPPGGAYGPSPYAVARQPGAEPTARFPTVTPAEPGLAAPRTPNGPVGPVAPPASGAPTGPEKPGSPGAPRQRWVEGVGYVTDDGEAS